MTTELEWKWLVEGGAALDDLLTLAESHGIHSVERGLRAQTDTYLDGPHGEIARGGGGLRVRRVAPASTAQALLCYKGPARLIGEAMERIELEVSWPRPELPEHTAAVPEEVRAPLGEHPLARTVELQTNRSWARLECAPSGALAELVADGVSVRGADGAECGRFAEIELEVVTGDSSSFSALAESIRGCPGVQASTISKLQRALRLLGT